MNKNILSRLYWIFWCATTMLTGILAGFLISHSVMLGRFFTWMLESGNEDLLRQTFSVFRDTVSPPPNIIYNIPLYLGLIFGILYTVVSFLLKRDRVIAVIAGLSTFWVGNIFFVSNFNKAEEAVMTGTAEADVMIFFMRTNLPFHITFAFIYSVSFFLLLLVALKKIKNGPART
ncbi:MAG: hypothetical protein JW780_04990 [Clostridiales bacterium]|nr:hypothetical protein [Clostridiales bacterium]